ncbi:glycerol-3-phosphate responsive antiterminator [Radiobacillus sp. PE A8.2]|uniref:glycerol-3-phosphate responsive antiterminator n=1 Tax=Radiobacillus sp. PE A8.2 TaxID=3380349 RepID=UPI00388F9BB6
MDFDGQKIIPSFRDMKQFEKLLESEFNYIVLIDSHINQLEMIMNMAKAKEKKVIIHADFVNGLSNDLYGAEYLSQRIKPTGVISTKPNFISSVKKNGVLAIQRMFLIDSIAIKKSYRQIEKSNPDYVEVLPGIVPEILTEVKQALPCPIIAGGLIRSVVDVENALHAGAVAISTTDQEIWKKFER